MERNANTYGGTDAVVERRINPAKNFDPYGKHFGRYELLVLPTDDRRGKHGAPFIYGGETPYSIESSKLRDATGGLD